MNMQEFLKQLNCEIHEESQTAIIDTYESLINGNIEELSNEKTFYQLPLNYVFPILFKIDFNSLEEREDHDTVIHLIKHIINNTIQAHYKEKETLLILQNINIETLSFTYEEIFSLLELITNCPFIVNFCNLYKEHCILPERDYEYMITRKNNEIEKLKQIIKKHTDINIDEYLITREKSDEYNPTLFKICKEGNLTDLQIYIEKENIDVNQKNYKGEALIHIASIYGHLPIVQYLIEKKNVDKHVRGYCQRTPLHYASHHGHLKIVEYLVSIGANMEAKTLNGWTPLQAASWNGHIDVVKYLLSKGAKKNVINGNGDTPFTLAKTTEIASILRY